MGHKVTIYTDGGARGNPGPAGIGIVIVNESTSQRYGFGEYIGETTNNQAEYRALLFALEKSLDQGADEAACFLDSELVVKQMRREYRVKEPGLAQLFLKAWNIASQFKKVSFSHIPRARNKEADALVNKAIDLRRAVEE
ncbi:MAG: ribonuclease HI family protein [bacterium]|nr:ribonuclease HI family protein [bacterium]